MQKSNFSSWDPRFHVNFWSIKVNVEGMSKKPITKSIDSLHRFLIFRVKNGKMEQCKTEISAVEILSLILTF